MPVFSIIVPVYNVEKYIRECIESIVNQTFTDFEAVFVDDCGTDSSIKIVEEYAEKDNRIKIIRNDGNKGVAASRNNALDNIQGKYFICVDSDDWIKLNTLEVLNNTLKNDLKLDSIWFDGVKYYQDTGTFDENSVLSCVGGYMELYPERIVKLSGYTCFKVFKTELVKKAHIYWPIGVAIGEDDEFCYKYLSLYPRNSIVIENRLYNYRIHNLSATNSYMGLNKARGLITILRNLKHFYVKNNIYDKYKVTVLQLLRKYTSIGRSWCETDEQSEFFKLIKELYKDLNCPENFKEFNTPINPLFSFVLPIKNECGNIDKIIRSIQTQSYRNIELIVIYNNDASIQSTINEYCKKDKRIKSFGINNFNAEEFGIKTASGYYISLINEHTLLDKYFVQSIINKFNDNNSPNILVKSSTFSYDDGINCGFTTIDDKIKSAIDDGKILPVYKKYLLKQNDYSTSALVDKYYDAYLMYENYVKNCEA